MNLFVVLLWGACATVAMAGPQALPQSNGDFEVLTGGKNEDNDAFDVEYKSQRYGRRGPRFRICGRYVHNYAAFICHPSGLIHHKRDDSDEFLAAGEANTFLTSEGVNKRSMHEECCHEGCWWEELLEHC